MTSPAPTTAKPEQSNYLNYACAFAGAFLLVPLVGIVCAAIYFGSLDKRNREQKVRKLVQHFSSAGAAAALAAAGIAATTQLMRPASQGNSQHNWYSSAIAPGKLAAGIVTDHAWISLLEILGAAVVCGIIILAFLGLYDLSQRFMKPRVLREASRIIICLLAAGLTAPVSAVAIISLLLFSVRLGVFHHGISPAVFSFPGSLYLPILLIALTPAAIATETGISAWHRQPVYALRFSSAVSAAARAFTSQGGWLITSLIACEVILNIPGAGQLFAASVTQGDTAILATCLWLFFACLLLFRIREIFQQAVHFEQMKLDDVQPIPAPRFSSTGLILVVLILSGVIYTSLSGADAAIPEHYEIFLQPTVQHVMGTDSFGRDITIITKRFIMAAVLFASIGGITAGAAGTAWAAAGFRLSTIKHRWANAAHRLLFLPAEAATLISPALVVYLLVNPTPDGVSAFIIPGIVIGILLTPRVALSVYRGNANQNEYGAADQRIVNTASVVVTAAFVTLQYGIVLDSLGWPIWEFGGGVLAGHNELALTAAATADGWYWRLGIIIGTPGILLAYLIFALQAGLNRWLTSTKNSDMPGFLK